MTAVWTHEQGQATWHDLPTADRQQLLEQNDALLWAALGISVTLTARPKSTIHHNGRKSTL